MLYWGISILDENNVLIKEINLNKLINGMLNISINSVVWENTPYEKRNINKIFEKNESHHQKRIIERYRFIANYLSYVYKVDFDKNFFSF